MPAAPFSLLVAARDVASYQPKLGLLARENRLRSAEDFRSTMKLGRKASTEHLVVYISQGNGTGNARFGFVVGKTVGNAVERNLVKRRARGIIQSQLVNFVDYPNLVIRALPGSAQISYSQLANEFESALNKLQVKKQ